MASLNFWEERIEKIKFQIVAYEDAIDFLLANPTKRYKLDTGQSEQEVTRLDIETLQAQVDVLLNRLTVLEKRISCTSSISIPGW